jgi:hypothetical protein
MVGRSFYFTYNEIQYEARAECHPVVDGLRRYKLCFPNIQSIVEGSVHLSETSEGKWSIERIMSLHPIPKEFLHEITSGFIEFIETSEVQ